MDIDEHIYIINIGGQIFKERIDIFEKSDYLKALFNFHKNKYDFSKDFISRDPVIFNYLLNCIRDINYIDKNRLVECYPDILFFQIDSLLSIVDEYKNNYIIKINKISYNNDVKIVDNGIEIYAEKIEPVKYERKYNPIPTIIDNPVHTIIDNGFLTITGANWINPVNMIPSDTRFIINDKSTNYYQPYGENYKGNIIIKSGLDISVPPKYIAYFQVDQRWSKDGVIAKTNIYTPNHYKDFAVELYSTCFPYCCFDPKAITEGSLIGTLYFIENKNTPNIIIKDSYVMKNKVIYTDENGKPIVENNNSTVVI